MEDIRAKAEEWNARSTKKVPYEFVEFCEGKRSVKASGKYCEWELTKAITPVYDFADAKMACGYVARFFSVQQIETFKKCPFCGKKIKLMKGKENA